MTRTLIAELGSKIGEEVQIAGWVDNRRDHGKLIFLDLRDRSGKVQAVVLPNHEATQTIAGDLRSEWVVEVTGKVNERPEKMVNADQANGQLELEVAGIEILSRAKELPFDQSAELNLDTYLDHLPLTLRSARPRAIFTVQARILRSFRDFLTEQGFVEIQAPKLIGDDAEGGANSFDVTYFNHTAHLAQSPQLYKQIMVGVFERVFATGNVYRAEKHSTTRHINEYTSLDIEMGFIKDHTDIMTMETKILTHVMADLKNDCTEEFKLLGAEIPAVPTEIPALKLRVAQKLISDATGENCLEEPDLEPVHERWLSDYAQRELGSDFIFITHFPVSKRPFYTYADEADPGFTKGADLLFRGIEITTLAQRIHDYDTLVESMKNKKLNPEKFSYYLQAFKYGLPPHGGFGLGLERLTARLLNLDNVKEATLFPRDLNRIDNLLSADS